MPNTRKSGVICYQGFSQIAHVRSYPLTAGYDPMLAR